ncbi:MAG: L,D-transpeptidase family protein [Planctomycetes bacterium]|nr:L,D-transpeptidase family protein [Planctomycetota bacterium]
MKKGVVILIFLAIVIYLAREKLAKWEPVQKWLPKKEKASEGTRLPPDVAKVIAASKGKKQEPAPETGEEKQPPVKVSDSAASIATGVKTPDIEKAPKESVSEIEEMLKNGNKLEAWGKLTRKLLTATSDAERDAARNALIKLNEKLFFSRDCEEEAEFYVVQAGDSLYGISRKFSTTPGLIRWANNKKKSSIRARERLKIPKGRIKLLVDKSDFRLYVLQNNRYLKDYPVGIGKNNKTPVGTFVIKTKIKKPPWYAPDGKKYPFGDEKNILGTRWMGFEETAKHAGYGIHGTTLPERIGKAESNGCICMNNKDIEDLFDAVPRGTEVVIRE